MVEIDGMKLVQTKAILNYIAEKYGLHGKDLKDRAKYDPGLTGAMNNHRCMSVCVSHTGAFLSGSTCTLRV